MLDWTQLYSQTHGFNEGAIAIASSFTGNVLAITATTKPEYAQSKQIIGYLFQDSGGARKGYALYSGEDILLLAVPQTDGLVFFPTSYLSDSYTLNIAYTTVGNILESNTAPIPDQILGLPSKVSTLESSVEGIGLALETQVGIDLDQSTRLTALEGTISAPSWDAIAGKPTSFPPASHSHAIGDITDLTDVIGGLLSEAETVDSSIADLGTRISTLESATPPTGTSSVNALPVYSNQILEVGKSYLSAAPNNELILPSVAVIGDLIKIATGNFNTKVFQPTDRRILNLNTLTADESLAGIVLKPYSFVELLFVGSNLWVTGFRSRTINNFSPVTVEPTASLKAYLPTFYEPVSPAYGTALANINNDRLILGNYITDGLLADVPTVRVLTALSGSVFLDTFDFYGGQGNLPVGSANDFYKVQTIKVYGGADLTTLLGTFSPSNLNGSTQTFTVSNDGNAYSSYVFEFSRTGNGIGIIELDLFGRSQMGGETVAV